MQITEMQVGCVALQAACGPSGLPLPIGIWYLCFQIPFLEMLGQHHHLLWLCLHGLVNRTWYFCWQWVKQVLVKLIMRILVKCCVYLQPSCETILRL